LTITGVAAGGDGIAREPDGRVVFVEGAIPGDEVLAEVLAERRDYLRAKVDEVLEESSDRVVAPCPEVERGCGGCQWQHVEEGAQQRLKAVIVTDALRRLAHLEPPVVSGPAIAPAGYRTTLRLAVDGDGRACFRRRHGHALVNVAGCLVAHPLLAELIASGRYRGASEVTLRVGARTGERMVYARPVAATAEVPADVAIARRPGEFLHEWAAGRLWRISAASFFQSGPEAAEALTAAVGRAVGDALSGGGHLLDAYCGVGLLGGSLVAGSVDRTVSLTGVESVRLSAADASANLADLGARVVTAEVADFDAWRAAPVDVVVADPARPGLGPSASAALASTRARVIVLVSCDPASLARDAVLFGGHGYRLASVEVVDLFPHTFHVETVSRFELVG
jgi:23S rRNA (uracil1939-C5)-methyltransferase